MVAPTSTPANAATRRGSFIGTTFRSHRSATRNHSPDERALVTAANRLIRTAYDDDRGKRPNVCASITKSGFPGGCGIPITLAAAMYSEVSQNAVVGARLAR